MRFLRPFFSYFGSKWRLAPSYPPPEHDLLIEPFAGSAGYALRHYKRRVVLIEKDPRIVALWRWLITVRPEEVMQIPLFGGDVQSVDDMRDVCEEARVLVSTWLFKGSAGSRERRLPGLASQNPSSFWGLEVKLRIARQVQRIRHWRAIEGSYETGPEGPATRFVDAPYEKLGTLYHHGSEGIDYGALGQWVRSRRGLTIVCEAQPASWLPFKPHRTVIGAPAKRGSGALSEELLWVQRTAES